MHRFRFVLVLVAFVFTACGSVRAADDTKKPAAKQPKFELRDGDRVVFLGNTLIERAQKYGYWETMLTARYPNKNITFRNLGWSGDTVWAESRGMFDPPAVGYKRMIEHVGRLKPTVIFVGYGNNEAFAGQAGLPAFIKQYNTLLDDLTRVSTEGVRFVILSPHRHETLPSPLTDPTPANKRMEHYVRALQDIARRRQLVFIDFYSTLIDSDPEVQQSKRFFSDPTTQNGIHLTGAGYRRAARLLIHQLSEIKRGELTEWELGLDFNGRIQFSEGAIVRNVKVHKDGITFEVLDERFPAFDAMRTLQVIGLRHAPYSLKIDGREVMQRIGHPPENAPNKGLWCDVWSVAQTVEAGPEFIQFEKLRQTIIAKNLLYFYSWRPQNITYLTGFRKHEQGQNAKELAEFDKLIVAKEKEINKLKKPVAHTYEIIRVKKDK
jgi:lysophospholipase L1-like esterase